MNKKILLGMSGGVDSSVSAAMLKNNEYEVVGVTMELIGNTEKNIVDAKRVCEKLGIEHHAADFKEEFKNEIIGNFVSEYEEGRTPNPCILCNRAFKFGYLYQKGLEYGCKYIATGHYAKVEYSEKYKQHVLKKSKEENKDQTYFLYRIPKERLEYIVFPLEEMLNKDETRKIASDIGLDVANKKDSQEICFIQNDDYKIFLKENMNKKMRKGNIVLDNGTILGKHEGYVNYTIGQRKGLQVSYKEPLFVTGIDVNKNEIVVGTQDKLYTKTVEIKDVNWLIDMDKSEFEVLAKIRYRAKEAKATVKKQNGRTFVEFKEEQRAVTKGQSLVCYDEDGVVIGGGIIC